MRIGIVGSGSTGGKSGIGGAVFAITMLVLGSLMAKKGGFYSPFSGVPKDLPMRPMFAYACAALCVAAGLGLLVQRYAPVAARILLALFTLWMLCFRLPALFGAFTNSGVWWGVGEIAVMIATAWVLVASASGGRDMKYARALYGLGIIPFGIAHFTFLERTVSMVPGWMPGHLATAYVTGGAFILAGIAIAIGIFARLAAVLSALEMGLFTLFVWGPVLLAHPDAGQFNEAFDSWVLTAAAWVVAESWRGMSKESPIARA